MKNRNKRIHKHLTNLCLVVFLFVCCFFVFFLCFFFCLFVFCLFVCCFFVCLFFSCVFFFFFFVVAFFYKGTSANSVKPDQTPQNAASDQSLNCLH